MRKAFIAACLSVGAACLPGLSVSAQTIADWQFNEGSGKTTTSSVGGFSAQLGVFAVPEDYAQPNSDSPSGAASDRSVTINRGLSVDDSSASVLAIQGGPITMEAWIRIKGLNANNGILAYGSSYKIGINGGNLLWTFYGVRDVRSAIPMDADDVWHHVAMAWEPGVGISFYFDGVLAEFIENTDVPRDLQNSILNIGSETNGSNPLPGLIDRVRIHNAVLDETQIDSDPANPKAPLASTVVAYNFDEETAPYQNSTSASLPTEQTSDLLEQASTAAFSADNPKGEDGDFSILLDGNDRVFYTDELDELQFIDEDYTIQAWTKVRSIPGTKAVLVSYGVGGRNGYSVSIRNTYTITATTYGISDVHSTVAYPQDNQWHHVAIVHHMGQDMEFYLDGELKETVEYTGGVRFAEVFEFRVGHESSGQYFDGNIDRLILNRGALTVDELDYFEPVTSVNNWSLF